MNCSIVKGKVTMLLICSDIAIINYCRKLPDGYVILVEDKDLERGITINPYNPPILIEPTHVKNISYFENEEDFISGKKLSKQLLLKIASNVRYPKRKQPDLKRKAIGFVACRKRFRVQKKFS